MGEALLVRRGGTTYSGLPEFTYTGTYSFIDDGSKNWRIRFLTSGTLVFQKIGTNIDLFLVGGGGGGGPGWPGDPYHAGGGGGGGYTATIK